MIVFSLFQETWYGDGTIYCIAATSIKPEDKGSTIDITEGGLNHKFVTFQFTSARGHGLDYELSVFANARKKSC